MIKITNLDAINKQIPFYNLSRGDYFVFEDILYLRIQNTTVLGLGGSFDRKTPQPKKYNAIDVENTVFTYFEEPESVQPVEVELSYKKV